MIDIGKSNTYYVKCIKPNKLKKAFISDREMIKE